jgi:hypothetical protein
LHNSLNSDLDDNAQNSSTMDWSIVNWYEPVCLQKVK